MRRSVTYVHRLFEVFSLGAFKARFDAGQLFGSGLEAASFYLQVVHASLQLKAVSF